VLAPARPDELVLPSPRRARTRPPLLLVVPACVTAVIALLPLVYLVQRALGDGLSGIGDVLLRERTARLLLRTLALAGAVTTACVLIGVGIAWLVVRSDLPWRRGWLVISALPLAVPTYVAAFAWISLAPQLDGAVGAFVVLTACSFPYVLLPVAAALRRLDPAQEEVARSLGLEPWAVFRRVVLPQLRPSVAAGALLVALYVLSDFGAVSVMRFDAFTRVIYSSYRSSFDRTPAAVLALLLVAVTIVLVFLDRRGRSSYSPVGQGTPRPASTARLGRGRLPALLLAGSVALLSLGVPAAALVYWSLRGSADALPAGDLLAAASTSLGVAALGAVATTALAIPVGVLAARRGGRLPRLLERASYLGHALPGVVVALAMVFLFIQVDALTPLYQRTPMLVLAYVVLFLPLAVGAVHASAAQSPPVLEEMARSAGEGPAGALRRVTLPLALPGIGAGAALVFLTCMKELPATLLLSPPGTATLATKVWTETGIASYSAAAPYAAVLVLLSAVPTYLLVVRSSVR